MKRGAFVLMLATMLAVGGVLVGPWVVSQAQPPTFKPSWPVPATRIDRGKARDSEVLKQLHSARKQFAGAETEQQKAEARTELRDAVVEYFEEDMQHREKELATIKQRIVELKSHLEKRLAAKSEIIDLQLRAFRYEADGLGLFSESLSTADWRVRTTQTGALVPVRLGYRLYYESNTAPSTAQNSRKKLEQLRGELKKAESNEARQAVLARLRSAMNEYFDQDILAREKQLDQVNRRLVELQSHLDKRRAARDEIVDLQVDIFVKEAQGMGFFDGSHDTQSTRPAPQAVPAAAQTNSLSPPTVR